MNTITRIRAALWLIPFCVAGLVACAPTMITGRISAATYQPLPSGASFAVLSSGAPTLTERHIQDLIANEMKSRGFNHVEAVAGADFAVMYSYSIGAGKTVVSSSPDFVFGGQKVDSSTSYPRYFQVSIIDVGLSLDKNQPVFVWQSEIYSSGSSQNISWLADQFVPKLFEKLGMTVNNERMLIPTTVPVL